MNLLRPTLLFFGFLIFSLSAFAQQTAISYQGKLSSGGADANGPHDLKFRLYDAQIGGTQLGTEILRDDVIVSAGVFTVSLDFGNQFSAAGARWLEIEVRVGTSTGAYTLLSPRSPITSTPFAIQTIRAQFADSAANADAVGGIPASALVQTNDPRLSDARPPTANSGNYIQNTTSLQPQAASNFNISGTGRANLFLASDVDSNNGYRLSGQPFLNQLAGNLALGISAGSPNVGTDNSLVGFGAGLTNTSNSQFNSFFGMNSGRNNNGGTWNTYIGWRSGWNINNGNFNTAIGASSGANITSGSSNSIFGASAGRFVTNGSNNSFFGYLATGEASTNDSTAIGAFAYAPNSNTVVIGGVAGQNNATLTPNVGIGTTAPTARLHVVGNTLFDGTLQFSGSLTGNGSSLTNLNAGALTTGTVPQARLGNSVIFNQTDQQATSNFNISGTGTAGTFNAVSQYNIAGIRILSTPGGNNIFAGAGAGNANTTGSANSFFGLNAGQNNSTGFLNSFFGSFAGGSNTLGDNNSFFGNSAGVSNTTGFNNAFFGKQAGSVNVDGSNNTIIGPDAGGNNTSGGNNTFIGRFAGGTNATGSSNTMLGFAANSSTNNLSNATAIGANALVSQSNSLVLGSINGVNGATADTNVGIGTNIPSQRLHVNGNILATGNATINGSLTANATTFTTLNANSLTISGTTTSSIVNASQYNIDGNRFMRGGGDNVFIGKDVAVPANPFATTVVGSRAGQNLSNLSNANSFFGAYSGTSNTSGEHNSFIGSNAGGLNTTGNFNTFVGSSSGPNIVAGSQNTFIGSESGLESVGGNLLTTLGYRASGSSAAILNSTAIGARSYVTQSNSLVLGSISGVNGATSSTNVGIGTTAPGYPLDIQGRLRLRQPLPTDAANTAGLFLARNDAGGNPIDTAFIGMRNNTSVGFYSGQLVAWPLFVDTDTGFVTVTTLGPAGSTQLCRNANNQIATCSSSIQYKTNVNSFGSGLDLIRKLRPVSFTWINGGMADLGLVAEEVAAVEPLLTTTNSKGEVEGVKYDRIGVILIDAIQEQQSVIDALQQRIVKLEKDLAELKSVMFDREKSEKSRGKK